MPSPQRQGTHKHASAATLCNSTKQPTTHRLTDVQAAVQEADHGDGQGQRQAHTWQAHGLQGGLVGCDGGHRARAPQQAWGVDGILEPKLRPCRLTTRARQGSSCVGRCEDYVQLQLTPLCCSATQSVDLTTLHTG